MKEYTVIIGGIEHTVLLTVEDAKAAGAIEVKAAPAPLNKARAVENKKL